MTDEELYARHPELRAIDQALAEHRAGRPVTARCHACGAPLAVTALPGLGSCWVTCPSGCTRYHARLRPAAGDA